MNVLCLLFGIFSLLGLCLGFLPCVGALNWLNVPFSIVGLAVSIIALSTVRDNENRSGAIAGVVCCSVAVVFGTLRLVLGGGVL
jgi:hypothetical protein